MLFSLEVVSSSNFSDEAWGFCFVDPFSVHSVAQITFFFSVSYQNDPLSLCWNLFCADVFGELMASADVYEILFRWFKNSGMWLNPRRSRTAIRSLSENRQTWLNNWVKMQFWKEISVQRAGTVQTHRCCGQICNLAAGNQSWYFEFERGRKCPQLSFLITHIDVKCSATFGPVLQPNT